MVPPAVARSKAQLPILKVRPGAEVECVLLGAGPIWYGVHWLNGRQHLCCAWERAACPLCAVSLGRVVGMTLVVCRVQGADRAFLLELSPLSFSSFEERVRFAMLGDADAVRCVVSRPRARGYLRIVPVEAASAGEHLLDADRRLLGGWAVLYGLPLPMLTDSFEEFQVRVSSVLEARARLLVGSMG